MTRQTKQKIDQFRDDPVYNSLSPENKAFIKNKSEIFGFSFQELKQIIDIATDLDMWQEGFLASIWDENHTEKLKGKNLRQTIVRRVVEKWEGLKNQSKDYSKFVAEKLPAPVLEYVSQADDSVILGSCPVASEKTRCCKLLTLDAARAVADRGVLVGFHLQPIVEYRGWED